MKPEFGNDLTNVIARQSQLIHTRSAGKAVTKVINQCNEAKSDYVLNLSECQLLRLPDAVYHLMRNTPLTICNLSGNMLSKLPIKFSLKFPMVTELNLSSNKISSLPDCLVECIELKKLDVSRNAFTVFPKIIFKLPKIRTADVSSNYIMDMSESEICKTSPLEELDLKENPLSPKSYEFLAGTKTITVRLSPPVKHEWDDL